MLATGWTRPTARSVQNPRFNTSSGTNVNKNMIVATSGARSNNINSSYVQQAVPEGRINGGGFDARSCARVGGAGALRTGVSKTTGGPAEPANCEDVSDGVASGRAPGRF